MIDPLPNARSICAIAASKALFFSISGFLAAVSGASDVDSTAVKRRFCVDVDTTIACFP
jgi:hypothetical protein